MAERLLAISDMHIGYGENRRILRGLRSDSDTDWLIVAGDVAESVEDVEWALRLLTERFAKVVWVPGNHELWTSRHEKKPARGEERYRMLVERCRRIGVVTPEDPYPVWEGAGGPARIVPLFLLYDYSFRPPGISKEQALEDAYQAGVFLTDEMLLHPDPYPSRDAWCRARVAEAERRLASAAAGPPLVLVNHWPLNREPTRILRHQEIALWCGTEETSDWHHRFDVAAVVYGHLHVPRTMVIDGVRFEEVSLGYPCDWGEPWHPHHDHVDSAPAALLRQILPAPGAEGIRP